MTTGLLELRLSKQNYKNHGGLSMAAYFNLVVKYIKGQSFLYPGACSNPAWRKRGRHRWY